MKMIAHGAGRRTRQTRMMPGFRPFAAGTLFRPILPALADELRTHLQGRQTGFLFEGNRQTRYSTRTVQSIVTNCARAASIQKRVYPHLLRHSIATILLDSGLVPIDQVQKFLGHLNLSTTQIYAETSLRALGENYPRALGGNSSRPRRV
jgi:integrase/recombinase XerD